MNGLNKEDLRSLVREGSTLNPSNGCWEWHRYSDRDGYGKRYTKLLGKSIRAHRLSYLAFNDDFDNEMWILHKCDNPCCVNPEHLYQGTNQDNQNDRTLRGRRSFPRPDMVGENNVNAILTAKQVKEIIKKYIPYKYTAKTLAKEFKVSQNTIYNILYEKRWKRGNLGL